MKGIEFLSEFPFLSNKVKFLNPTEEEKAAAKEEAKKQAAAAKAAADEAARVASELQLTAISSEINFLGFLENISL